MSKDIEKEHPKPNENVLKKGSKQVILYSILLLAIVALGYFFGF